MDNLNDYDCYDSLLHEPLLSVGWQAHDISWRDKSVDWDQYDAVIIRSPWDYQQDSNAFLSVLEKIEQSKALLMNGIDLVKWNINKSYLAELQKQQITIVPTIWSDNLQNNSLSEAFEYFDCEQIIIKPSISAGAYDTFLLNKEQARASNNKLIKLFSNREFMIQPFMQNIVDEGEFSLFFFNYKYSHCISKRPKTDDFRVQEEFGGLLTKVEPEQELLQISQNILQKIPYPMMYARLDFVRFKSSFAIMEAELIEPSLYFNMDEKAPARFASSFVEYFEKNK